MPRTQHVINTGHLFNEWSNLLLKFLPIDTAVDEAMLSNAECRPQLVQPIPGTQISELPVSKRIFVPWEKQQDDTTKFTAAWVLGEAFQHSCKLTLTSALHVIYQHFNMVRKFMRASSHIPVRSIRQELRVLRSAVLVLQYKHNAK